MSEYYGISPSSDFFAHYGVKGMKWGVRKAISKGGTAGAKALAKQYKKANKKLQKLKNNTDIVGNLMNRKSGIGLIGASTIPIAAGVGVPILAKTSNHRLGSGDKFAAGFNAAAGGAMLGGGIYDLVTGSKRTKTKGYNKAVAKVNDWQKEMKNAFKGTKYEKREKNRPEFDDTYKIYEYGTLGVDDKGKKIPYRTATVSIKGSNLLRDNNGKNKKIFKQRLIDAPQTQRLSESKVLLGVQSPSGRIYPAGLVNDLVKVKKKRK